MSIFSKENWQKKKISGGQTRVWLELPKRTKMELFAVLNSYLKKTNKKTKRNEILDGNFYTKVSMWTYFFWLGRRCPEGSTCDHSQRDGPEFTWTIVAAGDQRDERNEKSHKKPDSPHGWEEGKNQGTRILPPLLTAALTCMSMTTSSCSFSLP